MQPQCLPQPLGPVATQKGRLLLLLLAAAATPAASAAAAAASINAGTARTSLLLYRCPHQRQSRSRCDHGLAAPCSTQHGTAQHSTRQPPAGREQRRRSHTPPQDAAQRSVDASLIYLPCGCGEHTPDCDCKPAPTAGRRTLPHSPPSLLEGPAAPGCLLPLLVLEPRLGPRLP